MWQWNWTVDTCEGDDKACELMRCCFMIPLFGNYLTHVRPPPSALPLHTPLRAKQHGRHTPHAWSLFAKKRIRPLHVGRCHMPPKKHKRRQASSSSDSLSASSSSSSEASADSSDFSTSDSSDTEHSLQRADDLLADDDDDHAASYDGARLAFTRKVRQLYDIVCQQSPVYASSLDLSAAVDAVATKISTHSFASAPHHF